MFKTSVFITPTMSIEFNDTLFYEFSIRAHRRRTADSGEPPFQFVELRLRQSSILVTRSSHQILQRTPPTLIANALFSFPLHELQNPPPFLSNFDMVQFLSYHNLPIAIFHRIASFALRFAAGNVHLSFHIVAAVDFVETLWVEMDRVVGSSPAGRGAPATAIERLRNQKFELELEETGDYCSVCCDELDGELEVTRISCGHVFHQSCILNWLRRSNSCPLCRTKLEE